MYTSNVFFDKLLKSMSEIQETQTHEMEKKLVPQGYANFKERVSLVQKIGNILVSGKRTATIQYWNPTMCPATSLCDANNTSIVYYINDIRRTSSGVGTLHQSRTALPFKLAYSARSLCASSE